MTLKDDLAASTPGPWGTILLDTDLHLEKAAGRSIIRRNYFFGHAVVQPYDRGKRPAICLVPMADADHMADARLIARAPDMAAALIEAEKALDAVLNACDQGRMHPAPGCASGGMTIEANIRGSVYSGVPAWPIEEARAALARIREVQE